MDNKFKVNDFVTYDPNYENNCTADQALGIVVSIMKNYADTQQYAVVVKWLYNKKYPNLTNNISAHYFRYLQKVG